MGKRRDGRLPTMVSTESLARLDSKPSSELAAMRADLGSLMHVHGSFVNRFRVEADAITAILHSRDRPYFEVSDHAVVRWLEKVKGFDMNALRQEIAAEAKAAKESGEGAICRAKGDAVAYTKDKVTFIVAQRNSIVTVVFGDYLNPNGGGRSGPIFAAQVFPARAHTEQP
jgi:hypothetical protein